MALFTSAQLARVREIILTHHVGFAIATFGKEVDPELAESLKRLGLIPKDAPALIDDAYVYAQLMARAGDLGLANATPETILMRLQINPQPPHSAIETAAIETAKRHAGEYCRGLASRVTSSVMGKLTGLEASLTPDAIKDIIKDKTAENRARRETIASLKSDLGHEVKNWTRDWARIATSETNDAVQEGIAATHEKDFGDDVLVSKLVRPDCCPDCRRFYVGADGEPVVFKLSELRANGSNVGKRKNAWKPTVGNTHPWCGCQLVRVPANMRWKDGELGLAKSLTSSFVTREQLHAEAAKVPDAGTCPSCGAGMFKARVIGIGMGSALVCKKNQKHIVLLPLEKSLEPSEPFLAQTKKHGIVDRYMFQGLPIDVENPEGSARHWGDPNSGDHGTTYVQGDYGFIRDTEGNDGEDIDCYVGPDEHSTTVYVVHQMKKLGPGEFGGHDEDKILLGMSSATEAKAFYLAHYDDPRFFGSMDAIPIERFKRILEKNKGKRLRLVKSLAALDIGDLVKGIAHGYADLGGWGAAHLQPPMTPPKMLSIVQGADNVPKPERSHVNVQMADELGLTAKGKRKQSKEAKARKEAARERARRGAETWKEPFRGIGADMAAASATRAQDFEPPMLKEFREQSAHEGQKHGEWKGQKMREHAARVHEQNNRTSDISAQLAKLRSGES